MMLFKEIVSLCDKTNTKYEIGAKTAPLTSIGVGKSASLVVYPHSMQILCRILDIVTLKNYKHFVLGNGTNCYFCDYYNGIVIVTRLLNEIVVNGNELIALCGASLEGCASLAMLHSLSGLEFAHGIPGTVGGGVYINASAYGSKIADFVKSSTVYEKSSGRIRELTKDEHLFGEKSSVFTRTNDYVILETRFELSVGDYDAIRARIDDLDAKRRNSQPLDEKSAGSAFKKPNGWYASQLIDLAGLKGFSVGSAQVSKKHAGFIVNKNEASADEIKKLIEHIKFVVLEKFNVKLEEEIIYVE